MCGIAGIVRYQGLVEDDERCVRRMCDRIAHRGPDDQGIFTDGSVCLGHRRLAVIDVVGGHQPLTDAQGSTTIVYNGEVYNFRALRQELESLGHRFRTLSDTEVVLAAYREYGTEFVNHLNGMFAIAIWDRRRRTLLLARDRLGIKPLYVYRDSKSLAFASELKALLSLPWIDTSWDLQAIHDYFHFLYIPEPATPYRMIRQLEPGRMLTVASDCVEESTYWSLEPAKNVDPSRGLEEFESLLKDAVSLQTVSDVPIGAFLSGGIDSGLVVAFMSSSLKEPVRSFTVYDPSQPEYDERSRAQLVADRYSTVHRELVAAAEVTELFEQVVPTFDEPFGDSGALVNLLVCREGRRFVTVAQSGLGGDELSAGYARYAAMSIVRPLAGLPNVARRLAVAAAEFWPRSHPARERVRRLAGVVGMEPAASYASLVGSQAREIGLLNSDLVSAIDPAAPYRRIAALMAKGEALGLDPLNRILYTDLLTYIPGDLLRMADRTSMRVGLEVRVPMLDHRLVEHSLAIPGREKLRGLRLKRLLGTLAERHLPKQLIRAPKRGFSVPMDLWLRGPLREAVEAAVQGAGQTGVLDARGLAAAWQAHDSKRANHEGLLWAALVFSRWALGE